jgi:hypothetical protein
MRQVGKSSRVMTGKYGGQSTGNRNSANNLWVVFVVYAGADSAKDIFSFRIRPLAPGDHILSQKLLVDVSVYTFGGENQPTVA